MTQKQVTFDFRDQTVVITGASGGIGAATARKFLDTGAKVLLHANTNNENVISLLGSAKNVAPGSQELPGDFSCPQDVSNFLRAVESRADRVDIWVHAAGVDLMSPRLKEMPFEKKMRYLFQVDVFAAMEMAKEVGNRMKAQGGGTIVLFGWNGVRYGWKGETAELYGAAKGALLGFSRSLAESLAPEVRLCLLSPGWIKTRWGKKTSSETMDRVAADSLQNRWGDPDEIADAVLFFCSDASRYIDGIDILLDGGKRGSRI